MLERVVDAVRRAGFSETIYVSGYSGSDLTEVPSGQGPADSVKMGLENITQPQIYALVSRQKISFSLLILRQSELILGFLTRPFRGVISSTSRALRA